MLDHAFEMQLSASVNSTLVLEGMTTMYYKDGNLWRSPLFARHLDLEFGVSDRDLGNMSLKRPQAGDAYRSREWLAYELGISTQDFIEPRLSHSTNLGILNRDKNGKPVVSVNIDNQSKVAISSGSFNYDGLLTTELDLALCICSADCAPVAFYDPVKMAIGLVHAGLAGAVGGIVSNTVKLMEQIYSSKSSDLLVSIGPCIGVESYNISNSKMWGTLVELEAQAMLSHKALVLRDDGVYFDLVKCIVGDLVAQGVLPTNIECSEICTFERHMQFYSHYAAGLDGESAKAREGRIATVIMISGL